MSQEKPETQEEQLSLHEAIVKGLKEAFEPFKHLAHTPRALWGIYLSYTIEGLVYFGILTILGKYLSENVGLSDQHAGLVYSFFTGGITLAMLFLGGQADRLGVRLALYVSVGTMVVGRVLLAASGTFFPHGEGLASGMFLFVALGLFVVVLGYGMYQPAAYAGVKQFTDKDSATIGYAMIYGLMNLGAFFSGILSPPIRQHFGIVSVFWVYAGLTALAFVVLLVLLTKRAVREGTKTDISRDEEEPSGEEKTTQDGSSSGQDASSEGSAGKPRPLWTPDFVALVAAAVAAAVWIVVLVFTAPQTQAARVFDEMATTFKKLDTKPGHVHKTLAKAASGFKEQVPRVQPPRDPDARPNPNIYRALKGWVQVQAAGLEELASSPVFSTNEAPKPDEEEARRAGRQVRAAGIWVLAAAYSMVSRVDRSVVERLRRRMKEKGEKKVPLSAEDERALLQAVQSPKSWKRLAAASTRLIEAATRVERAGACGKAAAALLRLQARYVSSLASQLRRQADPQLEELAKDVLLEDARYLLQTLGPQVASRKSPSKLLAGFFVHRMHLAKTLSEWAVRGNNVPTKVAVVRWLKRYGAPVAVELLLVVLLLVLLLRRRPDHPFRDGRFVFFIFILIPVQTLFAHNWLTLPYYINRAFGGSWVGDYFEFFSNINPILIFVLTPTVAAITARYRVYKMMIAGTFVMALPTFLLALGPNPYLLLLYIFLMSVGEAMWQPRFLQWVAEIAPKGRAGAYMGIAQFPWFLTKVVTGFYSGWFLSRYCPALGPQNTEFLWFVYGLIAMTSPVALLLAKGWMMRGSKL